jgi:hypothetical protein
MPSMPEVWDHYRAERLALGHDDPGPHRGAWLADFYLAEDQDQGWADVGPYFLHETNAYGTWMSEAGLDGRYHLADNVDEVRAQGLYRVLTPEMLLAEMDAAGPFGFFIFHPLLGGITPELAWRGLELFEHDVLPRMPR